MMRTFNVKTNSRLCAFCQHWYDPTNAAIAPKNTIGGFWEYDDKAMNVCKIYGAKKPASASCKEYVCKV